MLSLTRKVGEEVRIGETIVVKVLGVQGTTVQLGIEAPKDVKVLRPELAPQAKTGK
jgi:carbon storage regulator